MNFKEKVLNYLKINEGVKTVRKPRDIPELTLVKNGKSKKILNTDEPSFLPSGKNRLTPLEVSNKKKKNAGIKNAPEDEDAEKFSDKKGKKVVADKYNKEEEEYKKAFAKDDEGKSLRDLKKKLKK